MLKDLNCYVLNRSTSLILKFQDLQQVAWITTKNISWDKIDVGSHDERKLSYLQKYKEEAFEQYFVFCIFEN